MNVAGWPFQISVAGNIEAGGPAQLVVVFNGVVSDDALKGTTYGIATFAALAEAGGLGGNRIDPRQGVAALRDEEPEHGGARLTWTFTALAIDLRNLPVLLNIIALLGGPAVAAVSLRAHGTGPNTAISREELAPMWKQIPFGVDMDPTVPKSELEITFAQPIPEDLSETIIETVGLWVDAGSLQAYRDWELRPHCGFLIPADDPTFIIQGSTLVARIEDSGIVEEGYDVLLNVLVRLHATVLPVVSVELA